MNGRSWWSRWRKSGVLGRCVVIVWLEALGAPPAAEDWELYAISRRENIAAKLIFVDLFCCDATRR